MSPAPSNVSGLYSVEVRGRPELRFETTIRRDAELRYSDLMWQGYDVTLYTICHNRAMDPHLPDAPADGGDSGGGA